MCCLFVVATGVVVRADSICDFTFLLLNLRYILRNVVPQ